MSRINIRDGMGSMMAMLRSLDGHAREQDEVLSTVADVLFDQGFERMRYYQVAEDDIPDIEPERKLFLTYQRNDDDSHHVPVVGFPIPWGSASISKQPRSREPGERLVSELVPIVESDFGDQAGTVLEEWVNGVDLTGRSWIDTPVYVRSKLSGVLCVDWLGSASDAKPKALTFLSLLGRILGAELSAIEPPLARELRDSVLSLYFDADDSLDLLHDAIDLFQDKLGIASAAVFRLDWSQQVLRRTHFEVRSDDAGEAWKKDPFAKEELVAVGRHLTGMAGAGHRGYDHVVDFPRLVAHRPDLVNEISHQFHEAAIGTVQTVMYERVSDSAGPYLVRLTNNRVHPSLPFLREHFLFQDFVAYLSPMVDGQIAFQRQASLSDVLGLLSEQAEPAAVFKAVAQALDDLEFVRDVAVIAHRDGSEEPYYWSGREQALHDHAGDLLRDSLYKRAAKGLPGDYWNTYALDEGPLSELIRDQYEDATAFASFPFSTGRTRGFLIVPMRVPRPTKEALDSASQPSEASLDFIAQLAAAIGQSLDAQLIKLSAEGALDALALVGHEMTTPLVQLSELVDSVLGRTEEAVAEFQDLDGMPASSYFRDMSGQVSDASQHVRAGITLGHFVSRHGRETAGSRQHKVLRECINNAIRRVRVEIDRKALLPPDGGFLFEPITGVDVPRIAVDVGLLHSALSNIYRNAIKYSIAVNGPAVITTRVDHVRDAAGRAFVDIIIGNDGRTIPQADREMIFEAFVRSIDPDLLTGRRRGLGLGLYLANRVAESHGGTMFVSQVPLQTPTKANRSVAEVFHTEFTLRIRRDLRPGSYTFTPKNERNHG